MDEGENEYEIIEGWFPKERSWAVFDPLIKLLEDYEIVCNNQRIDEGDVEQFYLASQTTTREWAPDFDEASPTSNGVISCKYGEDSKYDIRITKKWVGARHTVAQRVDVTIGGDRLNISTARFGVKSMSEYDYEGGSRNTYPYEVVVDQQDPQTVDVAYLKSILFPEAPKQRQ